jgi:hypothetical protein
MKRTLLLMTACPFAIACTLGVDGGGGPTIVGGGAGIGTGSTSATGGSVDNGGGDSGAGGSGAGGSSSIGGNAGSANGNGGAAGAGGGGTAAASGLPCDLANFLVARCQQCHSNPPVGGAPMPLVTYSDLIAPARTDASKSAGQMALSRMQDVTRPMPPVPAAPASTSEIALVSGWLSSGQPRGSCAMPPTGDGGAGGAAGSDAGNPFNTPPVCTSGRIAAGSEGPNMDPGQACIACHASNEGPDFILAGTVYPTAHEPNNCVDAVASAAGATVVIVDAANRTYTLHVNAVGSFYSSTPITTPFRAKVVVGTSERVMSTAQTSGDCNGCHTQNGANSAPGRILLP